MLNRMIRWLALGAIEAEMLFIRWLVEHGYARGFEVLPTILKLCEAYQRIAKHETRHRTSNTAQ